jgi:phosphoribosylformimino-5-aminoimidazole carboxamide ribotide isomerase
VFAVLVIPSVDILRGKCVQLVGGKPGTGKVYGDPVERAQFWVVEGAKCLHLIDLDAAMGEGDNFMKIAEVLAAVDVPVQVGGGVRTVERASELIGIGAERVVVGTAAVKDPAFLKELVELAGGAKVIVAVDSRGGKVTVGGWKEGTEKSTVELAKEFERIGVGGLLFTSVDVEGTMEGIAAKEIQRLVNAVDTPIIASGGVGSLEDVRLAKEAGAAAIVVGMSLYERKFSLQRAMEVAE